MKYNAKPVEHEGVRGFGVFTGKKWWPATFDTDFVVVKQRAAEKSAEWHLAQARALLQDMSADQAKGVAQEATSLIDVVCDRLEGEGLIDPYDPKGWLA